MWSFKLTWVISAAPLERVRVHGEAVILRRDLDLAGGQVHHRLIAAVVAELELVGLAAERQTQDLMAEADTEDRLLADQSLHVLFGVGHGVGIARPVGEKNAVGIERQHIFSGMSTPERLSRRQPASARLRRMLYLMP